MPLVFVCANFCCIDANCDKQHHHPLQEREVLKKIVDDSPEVYLHQEEKDPRRKVCCKFGFRCFKNETDCGFFHGLNLDGRKIIFKKFNKEWKGITMREKIRKEIEEIGKNGMKKWDS
jgi:hypothetical protein